MNIIWHGQSCFQITVSNRKNGETKLVIDPFEEKIGLKVPKLEADILLSTHDHFDHNNLKAVRPAAGSAQPFLITGPGEYEVKGISVQGIQAFHDNSQGKERGRVTCYSIDAEDGLKILHLGDFGQSEFTEEQLDLIGDIDILMIPVGGVYTISSQEAPKIVSQIEPRIVIPMHYAIPGLSVKLDGIDKFLKAMGVKETESQQKLSIKKKDLLQEETKVVVLSH